MGAVLIRRLNPSLSPACHNAQALLDMASFSSKVIVSFIRFSLIFSITGQEYIRQAEEFKKMKFKSLRCSQLEIANCSLLFALLLTFFSKKRQISFKTVRTTHDKVLQGIVKSL
jgi:hypothetical protein